MSLASCSKFPIPSQRLDRDYPSTGPGQAVKWLRPNFVLVSFHKIKDKIHQKVKNQGMNSSREFFEIVEQLRKSMELAKLSCADSPAWEGYDERVHQRTWSSRSTGDIHSERSFTSDSKLVAYLQKKEKLEEAHQQAIKRRAEKEMNECTFKPVRNSKSKELVAILPPKFSPLHHPKVPKEPLTPEVENAPRHLQISPVSRALAERQERSGPVHDRLQQLEQLRQERLREKKLEKEALEEKLVTGTPQLGRNSTEIMRRRAQAGKVAAQSSGVVQRLGEVEVMQPFIIPHHSIPYQPLRAASDGREDWRRLRADSVERRRRRDAHRASTMPRRR